MTTTPPGVGTTALPTQGFMLLVLGQEHGPYDLAALARFAGDGQLKPDAPVRRADGGAWFQAKDLPGVFSAREFLTSALLSWFLGSFGVDRFYLGYTGLGVAKLLTCGGLGVWHIIDLVLILTRRLGDSDGRPLR